MKNYLRRYTYLSFLINAKFKVNITHVLIHIKYVSSMFLQLLSSNWYKITTTRKKPLFTNEKNDTKNFMEMCWKKINM